MLRHSLPLRGLEGLVERERELAMLTEAFARARAGHGSLVLVHGVPGIGKSRLLAVGREAADDDGMQVLAAAGTELEHESSFGVALQLFESRLARAGEEERARLLSGAARLAAPLFAEGPKEVLPDGQAFSILHGLYWLCANVAAERPLALVIDDGHWVDAPSLRFLLYLAQRLEDLPVVVVLAVSPSDRGADEDLLGDLAAHPAAEPVALHPLSVDAVGVHLRESTFPAADKAFCRACADATGGNPWLLRELTRELVEREVQPTEHAVRQVEELGPETVARSVLARAGRHGRAGQQLAQAVAVLGDVAELRHAAHLAGLGQPEAALISDALRMQDIFRDETPLSFVHPVVARAIAGERPPAERAEAHLRAAELLAREEAPVERVADHLVHAPGSGAGWAIDILREAADLALTRGAPGAAGRYLERALAEPPDSQQRARLTLELARVETMAGNAGAVERLRHAVEAVDDPGERARARLETGRALHAQGRCDDAAAIFERGLAELNGGDESLRAQLHSALATVTRALGGGAARVSNELSAPESSDRPGDRALIAHLAAEAALRGDDRGEVVRLAREALQDGALLDEETSDGLAYYEATFALTVAEELRAAELALTAAVDDARSRGSVFGMATASFFRGLAVLRRGRVADAVADAEKALAAQSRGWRLAVPGARAILAEALIEQGDLGSASREVWLGTRAEDRGDEIARCLCLMSRAHVHLLRKRPHQARDDYLACGARMREAGIENPAVLGWRAGAALAAHHLGERKSALDLAAEELTLARAFGAPGPTGRALRVLATVQGGKLGLETLDEAVATLETSHDALERTRTLIDYGGALRRAGRRKAAREPLRAGRDLAHRLGAELLSRRATEDLLAAGARPRRTAVRGAAALTNRERQVAELAAQGLSNREIADQLFITIKTVEFHLRQSYAKLGVKSRRDLLAVLNTDTLTLALG